MIYNYSLSNFRRIIIIILYVSIIHPEYTNNTACRHNIPNNNSGRTRGSCPNILKPYFRRSCNSRSASAYNVATDYKYIFNNLSISCCIACALRAAALAKSSPWEA